MSAAPRLPESSPNPEETVPHAPASRSRSRLVAEPHRTMGRSLGLSVGLLVGLIAACTPKVPSELLKAREAYASASEGAAATMVPAELHKAHGALMEAEAAFKVDPTGYKTLDLAYIAQRKAQLANALASHANQDANTVAANAQYQATQDAIMANTRAELGSSKSDLAASQSAGALTAAQLQTSELARATAEKRANDAVGALARLAAVKEESRGLVITLSGSVLFRSDEATLLPEALKRLEGVTDALMETKERTILIEGHTDSQGSDAYNIDLSQRRAESVRSFLTARGYEPSRIRAVGIGEARPVAGNNTAEGRANNRRVEIVIEPSVTAAQ